MAIEILENQVVNFAINDNSCFIDDRVYRAKVNTDDCTELQMRLTPANDTELITNGNFLDGTNLIPDDWTSNNVTVPFSQANFNIKGAYIEQTITVDANRYYQLTYLEVQNDEAAAMGFYSTDITFNNGGNFIASRGSVYFYSGAATSITLRIISIADFIIIDDVSVKMLTTPSVTIETCEGVYVEDVAVLEYDRNYAWAKHCWDGVPEGCYRIAIQPEGQEGTNFLGNNRIATQGGLPLLANIKGILQYITWIP